MSKNFKGIVFFVLFCSLFFISKNTTFADTIVPAGTTISTNTTWLSSGSPYIIEGTVFINANRKLTIQEGTIIKFKDITSKIQVKNLAKLDILGTQTNKVYLTSYTNDSIGGDTNNDGNTTQPTPNSWSGISLGSASTTNINYTDINYASTGINNVGGTLNINSSTLEHNGTYGIIQSNGVTNIIDSTISFQDYGIYQNTGDVNITNSNITDNLSYGAYNIDGPFIALNNYWGHLSGPLHTTLNPLGLGNQVSNLIDFDPWVGSRIGGDNVKPISVANVSGTQGQNDWYTSLVTVSLSATDNSSGINHIEYSYDGTNFSNYNTSLTFDTGIHNLFFRAIDNAGNIEDNQTLNLKVDTIKPNVNLPGITPGQNGWHTNDLIIGLNASDANSDISKIEYSFDNSVWNIFIEDLTFNIDGIYDLHIRAEDNAGNLSDVESLVLKIDKTKPVTTPVLGGTTGSDGWIISSSTLSFTALDETSLIAVTEYSLDGGNTWNTYSTPLTFSSGTHTVNYRSVDNAGNIEDYQTLVNKVDSSVPVVTISLDGTLGNMDWYTSDVTVNLSAVSNPSGISNIKYSLDGGNTYNTYTNPFTLSNTSDVLYKATNNAGTTSTIETKSIKIDKTAPVTTANISGIQGQNGWYKSNVSMTLNATDDISLVSKIEYSLDEGMTWILYENPVLFDSEMNKNIFYRSVDNAGNIEAVKNLFIKIDKSAPEAKIILDPNTQDLSVVGIDTTPTTVSITSTYALVTNESGQTLKIFFSKYKDSNNKVKVTISKLVYNGVDTNVLPKRTVLNYKFSVNNNTGLIKNLHEKASIGKTRIMGNYKKQTDKTKLTTKTKKNNSDYNDNDDDDDDYDDEDRSCDDKPKTVREVRDGLALVGFVTDKTDTVKLKIIVD